jgi:hypothetical protein
VKKVIGVLVPLLAITYLFIILGGCAKSVPQEPSDIPSAVAVPNPASVVKSGNLAGANVEANNLKAAGHCDIIPLLMWLILVIISNTRTLVPLALANL